jgi:hypothetical protein
MELERRADLRRRLASGLEGDQPGIREAVEKPVLDEAERARAHASGTVTRIPGDLHDIDGHDRLHPERRRSDAFGSRPRHIGPDSPTVPGREGSGA